MQSSSIFLPILSYEVFALLVVVWLLVRLAVELFVSFDDVRQSTFTHSASEQMIKQDSTRKIPRKAQRCVGHMNHYLL